MDQKSLTEEDFEEQLLTSLMKETQVGIDRKIEIF